MDPAAFPMEGGCDCRHVRYRMESPPLIVHCCHCRWCQRETGTAFALNAVVESDRVTLLAGEPELVDTPSESGRGQLIARCPRCRVYDRHQLWPADSLRRAEAMKARA